MVSTRLCDVCVDSARAKQSCLVHQSYLVQAPVLRQNTMCALTAQRGAARPDRDYLNYTAVPVVPALSSVSLFSSTRSFPNTPVDPVSWRVDSDATPTPSITSRDAALTIPPRMLVSCRAMH